MARYCNTLPMVDHEASSFAKVKAFLEEKEFHYKTVDGENLFQKGDGVWTAPSFVKLTYSGGTVRLEAWINAMGSEQDLDGFVGSAAKKPLKKIVQEVERLLAVPGADYVPGETQVPEPAAQQPQTRTPLEEALAAGEKITEEQYFKQYASDSFYNNLKINSIIGYILCGIMGLSCLANPMSLIDLAIFLGLLLGMHLAKSKICAILLMAYAAFSVILVLVLSGVLAGWTWLIVGIYSLILFHNEEKRYRKLVSEKAA